MKDKLGFNLTIPSPCDQSWQAMADAGPAQRHCAHCSTDVVDIAMLTAAELHQLVARTGGHFCARITQHADGSMLLREPEPRGLLPVHELLRRPIAAPVVTSALASAMLACGTLPVAAQKPATPPISCADVTAAAGAPAAMIAMPAPAPPPAPMPAPAAPQAAQRAPRPDDGATIGKIDPIEPLGVLSGTIVMPGKVRPATGTVTAQRANGSSFPLPVHDGRYSGLVPRGRYTLRADVRGDDGQLYVAVAELVVRQQPAVRKLVMQGPMAVTAGAPMVAPVKR